MPVPLAAKLLVQYNCNFHAVQVGTTIVLKSPRGAHHAKLRHIKQAGIRTINAIDSAMATWL